MSDKSYFNVFTPVGINSGRGDFQFREVIEQPFHSVAGNLESLLFRCGRTAGNVLGRMLHLEAKVRQIDALDPAALDDDLAVHHDGIHVGSLAAVDQVRHHIIYRHKVRLHRIDQNEIRQRTLLNNAQLAGMTDRTGRI